jgi:hypothetical protein
MVIYKNAIPLKKLISIESVLDKDSGELTPIRTFERKYESVDAFFKMYIDDIAPFIGCTNAEKNILACLAALKFVEYNTNEIVLNAYRRTQLAQMAHLKALSLNNSMSRMLKKKIFIKDKGRLLLNPKYFFVGEEIERSKIIRLLFEYRNSPALTNKRKKKQ